MEDTSRKSIQILASLAANIGQASRAMSVSMSSYVIPQVIKGEGGLLLTESEASWFASVFAIGCITGALHGGYLSDKLGRKSCMILDCLGFILGFVLIGLSPNYLVLMAGRLMTGHFSGSSVVSAPIFVAETSHPSVRGITGTLLIILYCFGFTASMAIGALLPWNSAVLCGVIFPASSLVMLLFMKESPTWLLRMGRKDSCLESLKFYRGNELTAQAEMQRISENIRKQEKENMMLGDSPMERLKTKMRRAVSASFLRPFLLLIAMTSFGLEWGGFPALSFYLHTIIEEVHIPVDPYKIAIFLSAYRAMGCLLVTPIINKAPRRVMYISSGVVVASALFIQSGYAWFGSDLSPEIQFYARWTPLIAILLQYTGFCLGWGVIVYQLMGEILPSDMRSFGSALLGIIQNIFLFSSVKMIPVLISIGGPSILFGVYCLSIISVITVCIFFMPETKGLSLEDIEDMYTKQPKQSTVEKV